ncbi:MAG: primosomal protein N' [Lentisphaerae bacterium]|nr:primosomal protein N' [Lentisphaerota bacterium]
MIAKVITDISLDREFDYLIPENMESSVRVGSAVTVPFGRSSRCGYVLALAEKSSYAPEKLKSVSGFSADRPAIPENLIKLGKWISSYYCATQEHSIRTLLPAAVRSGRVREKKLKLYSISDRNEAEKYIISHAKESRLNKRIKVLQMLLRKGEGAKAEFSGDVDFSASAFDALCKDGLIHSREVALDTGFDDNIETIPDSPLEPSPDQRAALEQISQMLAGKTASHVQLLYGNTNSGKTEVYLQAISKVLAMGKSAIVLVPEISLTPQTVRRFRARFGSKLSVLHSRLSDRERFDEWNRINSGKVQIAIGARSALFAPFANLGLIVVDEEHDSSYKQSESPRYHARDVAVVRGQLESACVILGSATPSAESLYNVKTGKFLLCRMAAQVDNKPPPVIHVVDRRLDPAPEPGVSNLLSPILINAVEERLSRGEQAILFLNRRGYARSLCCPQCGYEARCPECSVNYNYTYSRSREVLSCHLCGGIVPAPKVCPECGFEEIRYFGSGTEKLESCVRGIFPGARVGRMDSDMMRSADDYEIILDKFRRGKLDILVGTQMIAKGLHFPGVTLVGVINADLGLSMPDFRAQERTFQMLTQVAGRAGRGERRGEVIFQTSRESDVIRYAADLDFDGFSKFDMEFREMLNYPPFSRMIAIFFKGENERDVAEFADEFAGKLAAYQHSKIRIVPPAPAPVEKIKKQYRYLMTIRGNGLKTIREAVRILALHSTPPSGVSVAVDVDPQNLM